LLFIVSTDIKNDRGQLERKIDGAVLARGPARQISRLLNNPRKVRDRLVVDGRGLSLPGLPDFRQVSTGRTVRKRGAMSPSKRMPQRQANRPIDWLGTYPSSR
jgi:hypothetical protein